MVSKAEFRLNEAGEVAELGVLVEPEMGDAKIWFSKDGAAGCKYYSYLPLRLSHPFPLLFKSFVLIQPYQPSTHQIQKCPNINVSTPPPDQTKVNHLSARPPTSAYSSPNHNPSAAQLQRSLFSKSPSHAMAPLFA